MIINNCFFVIIINKLVYVQKIRTIKLDNKTVKLQIVSIKFSITIQIDKTITLKVLSTTNWNANNLEFFFVIYDNYRSMI